MVMNNIYLVRVGKLFLQKINENGTQDMAGQWHLQVTLTADHLEAKTYDNENMAKMAAENLGGSVQVWKTK